MNRKVRRQAQSPAGREAPAGHARAAGPLREAVTLLQSGRLREAEAAYRKALDASPGHGLALHHLGLVRFKLGFKSEAADLIRKSVRATPEDAKAWLNLAVILSDLGRHDEARVACAESLARDSKSAEAFKVKGDILRALEDHPASADAFRAALELKPKCEILHLRLAKALSKYGQHGEALHHCERALEAAPQFAEASDFKTTLLTKGGIPAGTQDPLARLSDEAKVLKAQGLLGKALETLQLAADLDPGNARRHFEIAALLDQMGRPEEAFAAYKVAVDLSPDEATGYAEVALVLRRLELHEGAITALEEAIRRDPTLHAARHNLAVTQRQLGRFEDARKNFEAVLESDPNALLTRIEFAHMRRIICDWDGIEDEEQECLRQLRSGSAAIPPFFLFAMEAGPGDQLEAGRRYGMKSAVPKAKRFRHAPSGLGRSGRLKLGYISADFNNHATSLLLAEVLEIHDRSRFDITGYSIAPDDGTELSRRVRAACDRFVDLERSAHDEAARRINDDGIDILVDLNGYTRHSRPEIASHRPAPIQVNFLGYPATMGVDFMDYFIADAITVPPGAEAGFSEKVYRLPGCYQPNDRRRAIAPESPSRAAAGLPQDGFVFCCFNGSWKINARMFDVWMRLLEAVPGSVLWIMASHEATRANLEKEARSRGIAPERLVFAQRTSNAQHLARHALADLFLDCIPCNAHTTASDALWAGLPVLTLTGETFAARVAASLLHATGLRDLVTTSLAEYERLALALAQDRGRLAEIRSTLIARRNELELFDSRTYTRRLEAAYLSMADEYRARSGDDVC